MQHDLGDSTTLYIVTTDRGHSRLTHIKRRMNACLGVKHAADVQDPFMLHCLIVHEMLMDAKSVIAPLRGSLYDLLDLVDEYSMKPASKRGKKELENITIQLHVVSQEIDSSTAGAEMTAMIVRKMQASHDRYCSGVPLGSIVNARNKTSDTLRYLLESSEAQKRWLLCYKSRKDTALNLVSRPMNSDYRGP